MAHDSLAAAIRSLIALSPVTLVYGAASASVLRHAITEDRALMPSGYEDQYAVSFSGLRSDLSAIAADDTVSANGTAYRVVSIVDDSFGLRRRLVCREA